MYINRFIQSVLYGIQSGLDITTMLVFLLVFLVCVITKRPSDVPPGPPVFPVVGNLLSLAATDTLGRIRQLRKTYGDVFGLYFGRELFVFINGYELIHEALLKKAMFFSARPLFTFQKMIGDEPSILNANGIMWKEQRSKVIDGLTGKEYTQNICYIESRITEEASILIEKLKVVAEPVDTQELLTFSVSNVIFGIIFGERADEHSENGHGLKRFLRFVHDSGKQFAYKIVLTCCLPFVQYIPCDIIGRKSFTRVKDAMCHEYFGKLVNEALDMDHGKPPSAFIDIHMKAIVDNITNKRNNSFTRHRFHLTIGEMIAAGSETTSTTLQWVILHLVLNPEFQARLHTCIDTVIGRHSPPSRDNRQELTIVEATIMEVLRLSLPAPHGLPHCAAADVYLRGYRIPKGSTIIVCLHSVGSDPDVWNSPDRFDPDRFIGSDGNLNIPEQFIPFSLGRRSCLGESLARLELFLFTTALLQNFEFRLPAGHSRPSTVGILGHTYCPRPYHVNVCAR